MEWWEVALFLLVVIVGGCGFFFFICRLGSLFERGTKIISSGASILPFISRKPEASSVIEEPSKLADPELMSEVENNLKISSEPWTGELIPFDTRVWDGQQYEVYQLPTSLRNDLKQVYTDMGLANQLVWLSTEFNRGNPDIYENYGRMRASIAERLHRIRQKSRVESG